MIRINPVYRKELKQTARMKKVAVLLVTFNTLLALFGLFSFFFTFDGVNYMSKSVNYSDILIIYMIITSIEFVLILFITPGVTAGQITGEREKQTLDMLLSTTMTSYSIIRGKLFASINVMLMLSFSSLPIVAIVLSIGGISIKEILTLILFLIVTAIYIGSIGIFFSSLCKRSTIATVCTYTTVLIITLGLTMILMGNQFMQSISKTNITDFITVSKASITNFIPDSNTSEVSNSYLILLINPIFTFSSMLNDQIGIKLGSFGTWRTQYQTTYYIFKHWFGISIVTQIVISYILNLISGKILQPDSIRKRKKNIVK